MQISMNSVVSITYELHNSEGELLESSESGRSTAREKSGRCD